MALLAEDACAHGARARREARSLVEAGFAVTLLTPAPGPARIQDTVGGVQLVQIPVARTAREAVRDRRARRRAWTPPVGPRDPVAERAAWARLQAARLAAAGTRTPALTGAALGLRARALTAQTGAQRVLRGLFRRGWRGVDAALGRLPVPPTMHRRLPEADDLEAAFGPAIDRLAPDALHAHGVALATVAANASARAARLGRPLPWVYEASDPVVDPPWTGGQARRDVLARAAVERAHARLAAGVVVPSHAVADALQGRLALHSRPAVVSDDAPEQVAHVYRELVAAGLLQARSSELGAIGGAAGRALPGRHEPLVGIGPANMAGQAWAWAKALERELPGVRTEVLMVDRGSPLVFPADELVPTLRYGRDLQWQQATRDRILATWTYALMEAGRPLMGVLHGRTFAADARLMEQAGVRVGLVFHGSELRDPRRHAEQHPWSPFRDSSDEWVQRVQATVDLIRPDIDAFTGPCLVSTPDLLEDLPRATWLPVVVDCEVWTPRIERPEQQVPVVVHTPSRAAIKGTTFVDEALAPLVAEGVVQYRRIEGVPPEQMPAVLRDADIVLDQFAIASYGVLACQAMATGTAVVGHVSPAVRAAVKQATGHELPVIEASPDTLGQIVRQLVAEPQVRRASAQAGPAFVRAVHDGARSARVLADALGIDARPSAAWTDGGSVAHDA